MIAHALTIAGSDSGGGAGIQADLKTFSALGVYGASVITALTAQNTTEVREIHDVPAPFVAAQIDTVFADIRIDAVKVGMMSNPSVIEVVAEALTRHAVRHVVVDPVMVSKSGAHLLQPDAVRTLRERIVPLASVITPNVPEARVLLGDESLATEDDLRIAARRLADLGPQWVLVKGGHLEGPQSVDLLLDGTSCTRLSEPRVATRNTHGTGCTLSSAVTAGLARGLPMVEAVTRAKSFVTSALRAADVLDVGSGHGPLHHFYALWREEYERPETQGEGVL